MRSSLVGVEPKYADAIAVAVLDELGTFGIDQSRVELSGRANSEVSSMLSVGVIIDGAESSPMLIDVRTFKTSIEEQMDLLRAWLRAGHPGKVASAPIVQYKAGDRVPVPEAMEPLIAARDSLQ